MESSGSSIGETTASASGSSRRASSDTSCPTDAASVGVGWYDSILSHLDSDTNARWPKENERILLEPYTYLDSNPGKEIRSQIIKAFNGWLRVDEDKLEGIRRVVRMLHTSSLLIDDVEDNSELRRGIPVAHKVYGVPQTINSANYVYFLALAELFRLSPPNAHALGQVPVERQVTEELLALHRGQGLDLFWRDNLVCPTEHEYVDMVNNKTGGLLRIILKLMIANSPVYQGALAAGEAVPPPDLIPLGNAIGLLFQIRDDYMNLQPGEYEHTKGFAEDLSEGKFSFPVIHAIRSSLGGAESVQAREGDAPSGANGWAVNGVASSSSSSSSSPSNQQSSMSAPPSLGSSPEKRPSPLATRLRSFGVGHGGAAHHAQGPSSHGPKPGTGTGVPLPIPGATPTLSDGGTVAPNHQILSIVRQRPTDYATKRYAIEFLRTRTRSFEYCRSVMRNLDGLVREEIRRVDALLARREGVGAAAGGGGGVNGGVGGGGGGMGSKSGPADMLLLIMDKLRGGWYEDALEDERSRSTKHELPEPKPKPTPGGVRVDK